MGDLDLKPAVEKFHLLQTRNVGAQPLSALWLSGLISIRSARQKVEHERGEKRVSSGNFEHQPYNVHFGTALIGHQYCHFKLGISTQMCYKWENPL